MLPNSRPAPTRLLPRQTRLIHAKEGMRLRVVAGRVWLTQPNLAQDLFLGPGDVVHLMQDWVVVEADAAAGPADRSVYSAYDLQPLAERRPRARRLQRAVGAFRWLREWAWGASSDASVHASAP